MFRQQSSHGRILAADIADIERRMQTLEKRMQRTAGRASASVAQAAEHVGDAILPALAEVIDRFRGRAHAVGDEATRFGHEAARLGNTALRRLSDDAFGIFLVHPAITGGYRKLVAVPDNVSDESAACLPAFRVSVSV